MKTVVVYKSKTGFAKKYAEWIGEELTADIFEASNVTIDRLTTYDTIIFGGSLYAVGINGVKLITKNIDKLKGKKVVVFATGLSPLKEDVINDVTNKNFTLDQLKHIKFFYLQGGFDYSKLTTIDKVLMTFLKRRIESKKKKGEKLTSDETGILAVYNKPVDFTRKRNLDELIAYINL